MRTVNELPSILKISYLTTVIWPNVNRVSISHNCVLTSIAKPHGSYCVLKQLHVVRSAGKGVIVYLNNFMLSEVQTLNGQAVILLREYIIVTV